MMGKLPRSTLTSWRRTVKGRDESWESGGKEAGPSECVSECEEEAVVSI
jgi:hypothetical protein